MVTASRHSGELGVAQELDERLGVVVGDRDAGEHRHEGSRELQPGTQYVRECLLRERPL
jgi:hypothetical protein